MYTVIRFSGTPGSLDMLRNVGASMNNIQAGVYGGLRRAGDGFCCDICDSSKWADHEAEILNFVDRFRACINEAMLGGASITIDVAVEPPDYAPPMSAPVLVLRCEQRLMATLSSHGIGIEFSIY